MTGESPAVAIIGMACRFPGASNLEQFWRVLERGVDAITRMPEDAHVPMCAASNPEQSALRPITAYGFLDDIDQFDHRAFGVTPREAALLDPQHRIWLECVWRALEDAGHGDASNLRAGVFAGCNTSSYLERNIKCDSALADRLRLHSSSETRQILNGNDKDFLPLRTSYLMGLTGPSVNVQSACSTSLVAVASACRSLTDGETDLCIAGGASIARTSDDVLYCEVDSVNSADGVCRPFDACANGTVFGDGVGVVVLRRLADALADGDRVYAVIRGWAVNNDGAAKASFAAPSARAQSRAISEALRMAGFAPGSIGYVEAHGTGTRVGDPVEFEGLKLAFHDSATAVSGCGIGSVKSNIGHLDIASGAAGLIKTALALHHRLLPATLNFCEPNPLLGVADSPFRVLAESAEWASPVQPRRAGVSSLGVGGTNCHVVLEQAPQRPESAAGEPGARVLAFSAKSPAALRAYAARHLDTLERTEPGLDDYCFTACTGRIHKAYRTAIPAVSREHLLSGLADVAREADTDPHGAPRIAFLFPGQLTSYAWMGRELFDHEPTFRAALLRCEDILEPLLDQPLTRVLFDSERAAELLRDTRYEQPALFALQYALARLWMSWDVRPHAVLGYSLGEFAAACVAGMAGPEQLLPLVAERGRLMSEIEARGTMLSVLASGAEMEQLIAQIGTRACISAYPSEGSCVLSGESDVMEFAREWLRAHQHRFEVLSDRYAFHSPWVDPCLPALQEAAGRLEMGAPRRQFVSGESGKLESSAPSDSVYWRRQARSPVRFSDAVSALRDTGAEVFLEVGPQSTLSHMVNASQIDEPTLAVSSLEQKSNDFHTLSVALAALYQSGVRINWGQVYAGRGLRRIDIPGYPFQRRRFWFSRNSAIEVQSPTATNSSAAASGRGTSDVLFEAAWDEHHPEFLKDHRLFGCIVVPASSHLALLLRIGTSVFQSKAFVLHDLVFLRPVRIDFGGRVLIRLRGDRVEGGRMRLRGEFRDPTTEDDWVPFLTGLFCPGEERPSTDHPRMSSHDALWERLPHCASGETFYEEMWAQAENTGESFRLIERLKFGDGQAIAKVRCPARSGDTVFDLVPGVIEGCFQSLYAATCIETRTDPSIRHQTWVPFTMSSVRYRQAEKAEFFWCRSRVLDEVSDHGTVVGALAIDAQDGRMVLEIDGFHLRPVSRDAITGQGGAIASHLYRPALLRANQDGSPSDDDIPRRWLVLTERGGITEALAMALAERVSQAQVVFMTAEPAAAECSEWRSQFHAAAGPSDEKFGISAAEKLAVVYLADTRTGAANANAAVSACKALLELCSVLGPVANRIGRILICTMEEANAFGNRVLASAPLWGLGRVMMTEWAGLDIRLIGLDASAGRESMLTQLVGESGLAAPGDQIRYRDGVRRRVVLELIAPPAERTPVVIRPDRSYLIAGTAGDQVTACAEWMAGRGAGRVVLALPPAAGSADCGQSEPAGRESIHCRRVDLTDEAECRRIVCSLADPLRPLGGILLTPLVMDDGVLEHQDWNRFRESVAPTVLTAWNLSRCSEGSKLDFFVCFSSSAAVLGTSGQGSYAAACSYLDGLCADRRSRGLPALSINWGPWRSVGHWASLPEQNRRRALDSGWRPVDTEEALTLTGRLIASGEHQVCVLPVNWDAAGADVGEMEIPVCRSPLAPRPMPLDQPSSSEIGACDGSAITDAANPVRRLLSRFLGEEIGTLHDDRPLVDLGLDSLMAVGFRNAMRTQFSTDVPIGELLGRITIRDLTERVRLPTHLEPLPERRAVGDPSIVPIGAGDRAPVRSPLFCMQWLNAYRELAIAMADEHPVRGVWLENEDDFLSLAENSVEHLAELYLRSIKSVQPSGPYRLLGSSFAGLLAMEMAQQLVRAGERVDLLAMIDTNTPELLRSRSARLAHIGHRLRSEKLHYVSGFAAKGIRRIQGAIANRRAMAGKAQVAARQAFQREAIRRYQPQPFPGEILLFVAERNTFGFARSGDLGWARYAGSGLRIHKLPGGHDGFTFRDGAKELARLLHPHLK